MNLLTELLANRILRYIKTIPIVVSPADKGVGWHIRHISTTRIIRRLKGIDASDIVIVPVNGPSNTIDRIWARIPNIMIPIRCLAWAKDDVALTTARYAS